MFEELVELYKNDPHSSAYADTARNRIKDSLMTRKVKNENDPEKLISRQCYISKLRQMLFKLEIHHNEYKEKMAELLESKELEEFCKAELRVFDLLSLKQKLSAWKAIRRLRKNRTKADEIILKLNFQPPALTDLYLDQHDSYDLKAIQRDRVKEKTEDEVLQVDGDTMLGAVDLDSDRPSVLVASLLLVTGRRTIEILKTADFERCGEEPYLTSFKGQAKTEDEGKTFTIPLLAKYDDVARALSVIREQICCNNLSAEEINSKYAKTIARWTKERFGVNPHQLRATYAIMCEQLHNRRDDLSSHRMTYSGYISKVLGHAFPTSSIHYQRICVENLTGPVKEDTLETLISKFGQYNASELGKKKLAAIVMREGKSLTAANMEKACGKRNSTFRAYLQRYQRLVNLYHEKFAKEKPRIKRLRDE